MVAALLWPSAARAVTVVIVRPASASPVMTEAVLRIRGELVSAGYSAEITEASAERRAGDADEVVPLERVARQQGADGVIALKGQGAPARVSVYAVERQTATSVTRRMVFDPASARSPQTVAIRSIELLRSSFIELRMIPDEPSPQARAEVPPTIVGSSEATTSAARKEQVAVEVGAAVMTGFDGVGPTVVPVVSVEWAVSSWLVTHLAAAGLGTRPTVENGGARADISQAYGLVGASYRFRAGQRLQPYLSLSAGALRTSVEGYASPPDQGQPDQGWSFLLDGGIGTWLRLHGRFYAGAAAHVQLAEPYVGIRFWNKVVATAGRPNLSLSLALGAWL
jgi:hypothetical protein